MYDTSNKVCDAVSGQKTDGCNTLEYTFQQYYNNEYFQANHLNQLLL